MTYWPISSPSVFAATKENRPKNAHRSDDGVAEDARAKANGDASETSEDKHFAEDHVSGEICAVEVTRSGHMFATITRSTLTIWQTKVCLSSISGKV